MKPLIAAALAILTLVLSSCGSTTTRPQDRDENSDYEDAWRELLTGDSDEQPDISNLQTEQKFRLFMREGGANLAKYTRLEEIERNLLIYETDSEDMRRVLDRQNHYLQNALDCFSQALLIHPDSPVAHEGIALSAAKMGKYDLAIEHARIVLEGSESRTLIYRVLVQAYQRKAVIAQTNKEKILYLSRAAVLIEQYSSTETEPDIHLMIYTLAQIHAEIAANLIGSPRVAEYQKAAGIIDAHLKKYPNILDEKSGLAEFARKMQAASTRYKNSN